MALQDILEAVMCNGITRHLETVMCNDITRHLEAVMCKGITRHWAKGGEGMR